MKYDEIIRRVCSGPRAAFYRLADGEDRPATRIWEMAMPLGPRSEAEVIRYVPVLEQLEAETLPSGMH